MIYVLITLLILSCLINLFLMKALGKELIHRSKLEELLLTMKIEKDFERTIAQHYNSQIESGGNLQ